VISKEQIIPMLLEACPGFRSAWNEHVTYWNGKDAGVYLDLSEFLRFLMSEYERGHTETVKAAFVSVECFLVDGDAATKECAALGFIETLQAAASWKPYGAKAFASYLRTGVPSGVGHCGAFVGKQIQSNRRHSSGTRA
jgi:hypothetical protein